MNKKKLIIIISIIVGALVIAGLYGTFAASSTVSGSDNTYAITLTGNSGEVVVPASSSKTVIYQITNTNKGVVQYAIAYSGTGINVKVYNDSQDSHIGTIGYGENKFVKLYIENTGDTDSTVSVKTILGYEHGGNLDSLLPSGYSFVNEIYPFYLINHIINLYASSNPTLITQSTSNDSYYYSYQDETQTWGLMNDGLKIDNSLDATITGLATTVTDTTALTSGKKGNIRYFGPNSSVKNYLYFNCSDYSNQSSSTCEIWRIIGIVDGKVKIIRENSIGSLAWDQNHNIDSTMSYTNNWEDSSLQLMLNNSYYNGDTSGTIIYCSGGECDYKTELNMSSIGIKNPKTRSFISKSFWYLGAFNSSLGRYPNDMYMNERTYLVGSTIFDGNPFTINADIGLLNASDYGYGTDLTKCDKSLYDYNTYDNSRSCRSNNWLFNGYGQWLINPRSDKESNAWYVVSNGEVLSSGSIQNYSNQVRPVLYLDPKLSIESGNEGTSTDPYRISVS